MLTPNSIENDSLDSLDIYKKIKLQLNFFLVHPDTRLRRDHPTFLHHHRQARHLEDAHADRLCEHVQELLYHHGHVPPHHLLRSGRSYSLRVGQVRRGHQ